MLQRREVISNNRFDHHRIIIMIIMPLGDGHIRDTRLTLLGFLRATEQHYREKL